MRDRLAVGPDNQCLHVLLVALVRQLEPELAKWVRVGQRHREFLLAHRRKHGTFEVVRFLFFLGLVAATEIFFLAAVADGHLELECSRAVYAAGHAVAAVSDVVNQDGDRPENCTRVGGEIRPNHPWRQRRDVEHRRVGTGVNRRISRIINHIDHHAEILRAVERQLARRVGAAAGDRLDRLFLGLFLSFGRWVWLGEVFTEELLGDRREFGCLIGATTDQRLTSRYVELGNQLLADGHPYDHALKVRKKVMHSSRELRAVSESGICVEGLSDEGCVAGVDLHIPSSTERGQACLYRAGIHVRDGLRICRICHAAARRFLRPDEHHEGEIRLRIFGRSRDGYGATPVCQGVGGALVRIVKRDSHHRGCLARRHVGGACVEVIPRDGITLLLRARRRSRFGGLVLRRDFFGSVKTAVDARAVDPSGGYRLIADPDDERELFGVTNGKCVPLVGYRASRAVDGPGIDRYLRGFGTRNHISNRVVFGCESGKRLARDFWLFADFFSQRGVRRCLKVAAQRRVCRGIERGLQLLDHGVTDEWWLCLGRLLARLATRLRRLLARCNSARSRRGSLAARHLHRHCVRKRGIQSFAVVVAANGERDGRAGPEPREWHLVTGRAGNMTECTAVDLPEHRVALG